jgi:hypothetical protein
MANPRPSNPIKKGETRNPNGRPKSGNSITEIAKQFLEQIPEGQEKTYKEIFFEKVYKKAVIEGDIAALKLVWNYVDGMPSQPVDITSKGNQIGGMSAEEAAARLSELDGEGTA